MIPRKYQPLFFFVAMLVVFDLLFSLLSTCHPPTYQSAADQSSHQYHCTPFGGIFFLFGVMPLAHFLHTYEHELVAGFTIVLAFSTVALWLSTNKLWAAGETQIELTRRSIELGRDEFNATHRPKIKVKHIRIADGGLSPEQPILIRLTFTNVGVGQAKILRLGISYVFAGSGHGMPPADYVTFVDRPANFPPLRSGLTRVEPDLTTAEFLTRAAFDGILARKITFYCAGYIEYEDAVGGIRRTAFCRTATVLPRLYGVTELAKPMAGGTTSEFEYED